jgi:cell division protease FtsH
LDKKHTWNFGYWGVALVLLLLLQSVWQGASQSEIVAFSEFEKALAEGRIVEVTVADRFLNGRLKVGDGRKTSMITARVEPDVATRLDKYNIPYSRVIENTLLRDIISWVAPALVFFGVWYLLFRRLASKQGMGSFLSIGKSRAKVYVQTNTGVTFADVAGVDEAQRELEEVVDFLKHPKEYGRLGAHIPKGVLLVGPPGTGKTLLAKAVAGEAGVPFFSISGSEFVEMFVGVGAARVRDLFEQARSMAPAIIFIDELDALGRARGAFPGLSGHDEKEQTLNQLLSEMDGFDSSSGLIILSATNRPEILDPALLRAGRFDRQVLVDHPDRKGRIDILKVHIRKVKTDSALQLEAVAGLERKSRVLNLKERQAVAFHEMGHALVALAQTSTDPVHKVSIIPRGIGSLGYTIQRPTEDRYLSTRVELEQKIAVLMAGRAAEKLIFDEVSTGAADDLVKATSIAHDMVTRYGMDEAIGYVALELQRPTMLNVPEAVFSQSPVVSQETLNHVDRATRDLVMAGFARASAILTAHREILTRGAKLLLEKETLDEAELRMLAAELKPLAFACHVKP